MYVEEEEPDNEFFSVQICCYLKISPRLETQSQPIYTTFEVRELRQTKLQCLWNEISFDRSCIAY